MKVSQDWQNIAIISLITISIWAGIELYNAYITPATPEIYQALIQPLEPSLNLPLLESLKTRKDYSDLVDNIGNPTTTTTDEFSLPVNNSANP